MPLTVEEMVDLIKAGRKGATTDESLDSHAVYRALGKLHIELHKQGYIWDRQTAHGLPSWVERDHSNQCYLEDKEVVDQMEATWPNHAS